MNLSLSDPGSTIVIHENVTNINEEPSIVTEAAFFKLPFEVQNLILGYLDVVELGSLICVSKEMNAVACRDEVWSNHLKFLLKTYFDEAFIEKDNFGISNLNGGDDSYFSNDDYDSLRYRLRKAYYQEYDGDEYEYDEGDEGDDEYYKFSPTYIAPITPLSERSQHPTCFLDWIKEWLIMYVNVCIGVSALNLNKCLDFVDLKKEKKSNLTKKERSMIVKQTLALGHSKVFFGSLKDAVIESFKRLPCRNRFINSELLESLFVVESGTRQDFQNEKRETVEYSWLFRDISVREYYRRAGSLIWY